MSESPKHIRHSHSKGRRRSRGSKYKHKSKLKSESISETSETKLESGSGSGSCATLSSHSFISELGLIESVLENPFIKYSSLTRDERLSSGVFIWPYIRANGERSVTEYVNELNASPRNSAIGLGHEDDTQAAQPRLKSNQDSRDHSQSSSSLIPMNFSASITRVETPLRARHSAVVMADYTDRRRIRHHGSPHSNSNASTNASKDLDSDENLKTENGAGLSFDLKAFEHAKEARKARRRRNAL